MNRKRELKLRIFSSSFLNYVIVKIELTMTSGEGEQYSVRSEKYSSLIILIIPSGFHQQADLFICFFQRDLSIRPHQNIIQHRTNDGNILVSL